MRMEASRLKYSGKVPEEETGDGPPPSQTPESNKRASACANRQMCWKWRDPGVSSSSVAISE